MRKLAFTLLSTLSLTALSDESFKFVSYNCVPEAGYMQFQAVNIDNIGAYSKNTEVVKAIERQSNLIYGSDFTRNCNLDNKSVSFTLDYPKPRVSGECAGDRSAKLTITVDSKEIVKSLKFQSSCFDYAVEEVSLTELKYGYIKICGRLRTSNPYNQNQVCAYPRISGNKIYDGDYIRKEFSKSENQ